jgi:purine-binding chemotaxis protein CheW
VIHEASQSGEAPRQFLTYNLAGEEHAFDILRVQEIRRYSAITSVPNTARYVRGVMNLRGTIVPVIDLRVRFGIEPIEYTKWTVIITLMIGAKLVGVIVDGVSDVVSFHAAELKPPPELGDAIEGSFLTAMADTNGRLISLIDIDRVLGVEAIVGTATT